MAQMSFFLVFYIIKPYCHRFKDVHISLDTSHTIVAGVARTGTAAIVNDTAVNRDDLQLVTGLMRHEKGMLSMLAVSSIVNYHYRPSWLLLCANVRI